MRLSRLVTAGLVTLITALPHNDPPSPATTPIGLTNIISIVEDQAKVERATQLLTAYIEKVKQNEPGVQVYELDLDRNRSQFLTFEVYENRTAFNTHFQTSYLAELLATQKEERLKRAKDQLYHLDLVTRFIREPIEANA